MSRVAIIPLLCASCATTGLDTASSGEFHAQGSPSSSSSSSSWRVESASPLQIKPIDATLPSVDRIAPLVHAEFGDDAKAKLRLCVQPSGKLATVQLAEHSMLPQFDDAVIQDVTAWRFEPTPGPNTVGHCELLTLVYEAHLG